MKKEFVRLKETGSGIKAFADKLETLICLVALIIAAYLLMDDMSVRKTIRAGNRIVEKLESYYHENSTYPDPERSFADIGLVPAPGLGGAAAELAGSTFFYSGGGEYFTLLTANSFDESFEYSSYSGGWISLPFYKSGENMYPLVAWRRYVLFIVAGICLLKLCRKWMCKILKTCLGD
ncbi:MAG: hypothetical protein IJU95_07855 [Treponema sp.]|nr:hypothetical protein [Treponema sp.]